VHVDADFAVIGSGFAGSLTALCLRRRGHRVALIERGRHPRFAIGESSTPLANLLLEELADRYDLPRIRVFSKWGTWQRARPEVACGLKRGFTFFFHTPGEPFADGPEHARQLLVAASPHDEVGDTHWYRADFDHALVREAEANGVEYVDEALLDRFQDVGARVVLEGTRRGAPLRVSAGFLIDASGPRGYLHRTLGHAEAPLRWLPPTQGLYTHFEGVGRWDAVTAPDGVPPYAVDDAAVHHVFPGGWMWVLRFNNGVTSAGAALTDAAARGVEAAEGAAAWTRLLDMFPSVARQFHGAREVRPFVHTPRLAFRSAEVCGANWALLPSAAGVIDPLLSTGFPLTLFGIHRLLHVLERTSGGQERAAALRAYADVTQRELDATEQLVAALYASMADPTLFKRHSLLYFAASIYSETARRRGRPDLAPGFLLHGRAPFGTELRACLTRALQPCGADARQELLARIDRTIEPIDVAGLLDRSRRDWHPAGERHLDE
jgi:FADH2 O2-dependent halogenase